MVTFFTICLVYGALFFQRVDCEEAICNTVYRNKFRCNGDIQEHEQEMHAKKNENASSGNEVFQNISGHMENLLIFKHNASNGTENSKYKIERKKCEENNPNEKKPTVEEIKMTSSTQDFKKYLQNDLPMLILIIGKNLLENSEHVVIIFASLLLITSLISFNKIKYLLGKDSVTKYARLEKEFNKEIDEITLNWKRHVSHKQQALFNEIHNELQQYITKIVNDLKVLYVQSKKVNEDVRTRMRYILSELKKCNMNIKKNEYQCQKELEKICSRLLILKEEEQFLHNELNDAADSIESIHKIMKDDNLFINHFLREIFLCVHVRLMIEKHEDPRIRQEYSKIALQNLYWNLESIGNCNEQKKQYS